MGTLGSDSDEGDPHGGALGIPRGDPTLVPAPGYRDKSPTGVAMRGLDGILVGKHRCCWVTLIFGRGSLRFIGFLGVN